MHNVENAVTLMQRMAAAEIKIIVLEKAMERAFGRRWLDLLTTAPPVTEKREPE